MLYNNQMAENPISEQMVLPANSLYTQLIHAKPHSAQCVYFSPQNGSSFGAGGRMDFHISSTNGILNGKNSYLQFHLALTGTSPDRLQDRGTNIIDRIVISSGGVQIQDIRDYATIESLFHNMVSDVDYNDSVGAIEEGHYHYYDKTAKMSANKTYVCQLNCTILGSPKKLPLYLLPAGIQVEIYIRSSLTACYYGTVTAITITDVKFIAEFEEHDPSYIMAYKQKLAQSGIAIPFYSYDAVSTSVASGVSSDDQLVLTNTRGLKSIFTIFRADTPTTTNWWLENWRPFALSSYQYRIGSRMVPEFAVAKNTNDSSYACYFTRMRRAVNLMGDVSRGSLINLTNYVQDTATPWVYQLVTAMDLEETDQTAFTVAASTGLTALSSYVYLNNFAGNDCYLFNGRVALVTAVADATHATIATPAIATADAVTDNTDTAIIASVNGPHTTELPPLGKFVIGESFEIEDITHREDASIIDMSDKGALRFIATWGTTTAKTVTHIMNYSKVLMIRPNGIAVY